MCNNKITSVGHEHPQQFHNWPQQSRQADSPFDFICELVRDIYMYNIQAPTDMTI